MKQKVSLKELVGTKIIYAGLIAAYYWMWARQDWHSGYDAIQNAIFLFTIVFFILQASRIRRYSKEEKDQQAIQALRRTDAEIGRSWRQRRSPVPSPAPSPSSTEGWRGTRWSARSSP